MGRLLHAVLASISSAALVHAAEVTCPATLEGAQKLVVVTTTNMDTARASVQKFERLGSGGPWRPVGKAEPAVVGSAGLAWGYPFRTFAAPGEPIKVEGDKRTPAGIYRIGQSFGFAAAPLPHYLLLRTGETICVDDPASPAYNTIVPRSTIDSGISGEDMREIDLYRRGLVIDYPTDREHRAGSCIFIHVWRAPAYGTAGCVALPESSIAELQSFAQDGAVISILPASSPGQLQSCLPAADHE